LADAERLVHDGLDQGQNKSDGYTVLSVLLLRSDRYDEAEHNARAALALNSRAFNAYLVLADVHDHRKDYSAEVHDLDHFLAVEPSGPRADYVQHLRETAQQHIILNPVAK
jgi:tetratricopeptide (TPR) repeat protein